MAEEPLLFVFGPLMWLDSHDVKRSISGLELFDDLTSRGVWFSSRLIPVSKPTAAIFHLKKSGVIAAASIEGSSPPDESDAMLLSRYGLDNYFKCRFNVTSVRRFETPVDLKPLIPSLSFITNKGSHWGTVLRTTPRRIPLADYDRIVSLRQT
jgi:hypothetical protein